MIFAVGVRPFPGRHIQLRNPHRICSTTRPVFQASSNQSIFVPCSISAITPRPSASLQSGTSSQSKGSHRLTGVRERSGDLYRDT
jgi:hypothetical protein